MKKDNIIILVSAAVLVVSAAAAHFIDISRQGYPTVAFNGRDGEFMAAENAEYDPERGVITVKVRTNAPEGSIVKIEAQHPYTSKDMHKFAVVNNGKAKAEIEIDTDLGANIIPVTVVMDMSENQHSPKAVEEYGAQGEKLVGDLVEIGENGFAYSTVECGEIFYPDEQSYKNEQFSSFLYYYVLQQFSAVFEYIKPAEDGSWSEINIYITEEYSKDEHWSTMTDDVLNDFYGFFTQLAKEAEVVGKNDDVKITFYSHAGDVLAQNY